MIMHRNAMLLVNLTAAGCIACGGRDAAPVAQLQLTCNDSTAPLASYRQASLPTLAAGDSSGALIVRLIEGNPPRPVLGADVQLWGPGSGAGEPPDSSGVARYEGLRAGLWRLSVRRSSEQVRPWQYAATARALHADTVVVNFDLRCTQRFRSF